MTRDNNKKTHYVVLGGKGGGGQAESVEWDDILNKPEFATVATSGSYNDLTVKPTILTQWFGTQAEYDAIETKDPNTIYNIEGSDNVQSDWNQTDTTADDYIKNKPTIPAAQVNSDWNANSGVAQILNKPTIPTVPAMATETLTFTLQGGTTKTINFYVEPNYFYVEDISGSDNTLSITKDNASAPTIEVFKSTDMINWTSMGTTSTTAITATIPANGKLYLKATANSWGANPYTIMGNKITASGNHNVGGNTMSLLYGDNYRNQTTLNKYSFSKLFINNTKLVNAGNLELPATTMTVGCYQSMFAGCSNLVTTPALPATTLAGYCYNNMFGSCTSLTTAPSMLPATTLANYCYENMFQGCSNLVTAPALPATTLATCCYVQMFRTCSSLTTAPELPATTLANNCYQGMFHSCYSLTTAPELPATTLANNCYQEMFNGCRFTTPPALPATTLAERCYSAMFQGCRFTTAPVLPATTLVNSCYTWMFKNSSVKTVITYADDISANNCLNNWLDSTSSTGDFYNLGTATYPSGVSGIPSGWTVHTSL